MSGLNLALDVRLAYVDEDGVPIGGYIGIVNPVSLGVETPEPTRTQRVSKMRDSYGQALDEIVTPSPTQITFSTDETGDAEVLGWGLNGEAVNYTQAAATVTDAVTAVVKGKWVRLPHRSISSLVIEPEGGGTAYTLNTDYLVDAISGMVLITQGGAIATGDVQVSYSAAALTGKRVDAGTRANINVRIEGEGTNRANGRPVHVVVPRASLSASGTLDLVGDEFLVTELTGTALKLTGRAPVEVTYLDAA
jgi:hypothetical protein